MARRCREGHSEVNPAILSHLEGMHDIYYGTALPPDRKPIEIAKADDRIGQPTFRVDPTRLSPSSAPKPRRGQPRPRRTPSARPSQIMSWTSHMRCAQDGFRPILLPLQAGIGNGRTRSSGPRPRRIPRPECCYTEVIQDGMLHLIKEGIVTTPRQRRSR